jgi:2-polyprenyl-6-methoxyphenol hydroxylase-like FAD-dependent oxidoreductase
MCADIVIVGGGPVGLWTAIQLKKRDPGLDVQVYERYEEYQRSHILHLEMASLLFYSKTTRDRHEDAFYQEITGKRPGGLTGLFKKAAGAVNIRTLELEKALKNYAGSVGVKVAYETVADPAEVMKKHPECKTFIAADGAHSRMRTALLGENSVDEQSLQHVVEIKYEADGRAGKLGALGDAYRTNKLLSSMAFEYVGREKEGSTPVTLRFFIDKDTYDALPQAGFRDPLKLGDERIPAKLAKDIQTYMNARKAHAGEHYRAGSAKISKLTLSVYAAKTFALETDTGQSWFLVGDAAMGVPFFRSLNSGLIVGSQLALILTRGMAAGAEVQAYNAMRPLNIGWEFTGALGKDTGLQVYDLFRRASSKVPWEVNKWNEIQAAELTNDDVQAVPASKQRGKPGHAGKPRRRPG